MEDEKTITQEEVEEYFNRDFTDVKEHFEFEFEKLKKNLHIDITKLFNRFPNARNFDIKFNYDWVVNCDTDIQAEHSGWHDNIVEKVKKKLSKEKIKNDKQ